MMRIFLKHQIKAILPSIDLISDMEAGFAGYSAGRVEVPPVGELLLDKGEVHIKYGYIRRDEYYVIKIASGFYGNPRLGLPSSNGLMLVFRQRTGELASILLDEGLLTDTRTAVAGAIAAKYFGPKKIRRIGIVGAGVQARIQLEHLKQVTDCRKALVWARIEPQMERYSQDMKMHGFDVEIAKHPVAIPRRCNLIVTTTPATAPLIHAADLRPGTHITAVGSDTPDKQELDSAILARADIVAADSIRQCLSRGEIHRAILAGRVSQKELIELGDVIAGKAEGRTSDAQTTVVDLTGVAVQDIKIASAVHDALTR
ncbi:MAG: ornithine cyclodeaminase family protein [Desulfobacterales bacterium]|nr:ornithine cyclodeaminase family protein [Desulfobacterales bacterium]